MARILPMRRKTHDDQSSQQLQKIYNVLLYAIIFAQYKINIVNTQHFDYRQKISFIFYLHHFSIDRSTGHRTSARYRTVD